MSGTSRRRSTSCTQRVGVCRNRFPRGRPDYCFVLKVVTCFVCLAGIAHRDLKLENILCEYTDRVSDL